MYSSPSCWHDALPAVAVAVAAEDEADWVPVSTALEVPAADDCVGEPEDEIDWVPVSTAAEVPAADDCVGEPEADELGSAINWAPSTPLDETPVV